MAKFISTASLALVIALQPHVTLADVVPPDVEVVSEAEQKAEKGRRVTLGVGVLAVPDYEGSEDLEGVLFPLLRIHWESGRYFELIGTRFRLNLLGGFEKWRAGPMLSYNPGRDDVDNDRVDALRDIDDTIEAGGFVIFDAGTWETYLEFLTDIDDEHDGSLVTFRQSYKRPLENRRLLRLNFSLTYADDDYMESFFGIDANNATRSGLKTFEADADFKDIGVSAIFLQNVSKHWNMAYTLGYKRLLGDAEDSPIVDDEGSANQFFGGIIGAYTF